LGKPMAIDPRLLNKGKETEGYWEMHIADPRVLREKNKKITRFKHEGDFSDPIHKVKPCPGGLHLLEQLARKRWGGP